MTSTVRPVLVCGLCLLPAQFHTEYHRTNFEFACERNEEDIIANGEDLYHYSSTYNDFYSENPELTKVYWFDDHTGPEAYSGSDLAQHRIAEDRDIFGIGADDFDDPNHNVTLTEFDKVARWNDATFTQQDSTTKSWICTSIDSDAKQSGEYRLSQTPTGRTKTYLGTVSTESIDKTRNVFLDNQPGFTSVELLNLELTEKYQRRLLNVFADKNGRVRIGSIVINDNADGTKTATCVRDECRLSATTPSFIDKSATETRRLMEDFVWAIVAHGNNHAAYWFTSRPSFHKVHRLNCDHAKCTETTHYCAYIKADPEPKDQLVNHYESCKTPGCNCTGLLLTSIGA